MSTLREAIRGSIGQAELARRLGVTPAAVSQWFSGDRPIVPIERCVQIERETGVRRWDLRPDDWHCIWPELIGTRGAPDVRKAA